MIIFLDVGYSGILLLQFSGTTSTNVDHIFGSFSLHFAMRLLYAGFFLVEQVLLLVLLITASLNIVSAGLDGMPLNPRGSRCICTWNGAGMTSATIAVGRFCYSCYGLDSSFERIFKCNTFLFCNNFVKFV